MMIRLKHKFRKPLIWNLLAGPDYGQISCVSAAMYRNAVSYASNQTSFEDSELAERLKHLSTARAGVDITVTRQMRSVGRMTPQIEKCKQTT